MQLQGKTDKRFVEGAFRLARDCLGIRTVLTPAHFLEHVRVRQLLLTPRILIYTPHTASTGFCLLAPGHHHQCLLLRSEVPLALIALMHMAWHTEGAGAMHSPSFNVTWPDMPHLLQHLQGFAERKILLLCDIISACRKVHNDALRRERLSSVRASRKVRGQ